MLDDLIEESKTRRDIFKAIGATALAGALLGSAGFDPAMAQELKPSAKPLKAAMGNAGLQASWCAQGKQAADHRSGLYPPKAPGSSWKRWRYSARSAPASWPLASSAPIRAWRAR